MANHELPRRGSAAANGLGVLQGMGGVAPAVSWCRVAGHKGGVQQFHANVIDRLLLAGLVVAEDIQFVVTKAGNRFLGLPSEAAAEQPGVPVAAPYRPSPMSRAPRSRSAMVFREGAFDYRNAPSLMAGERLPYRST